MTLWVFQTLTVNFILQKVDMKGTNWARVRNDLYWYTVKGTSDMLHDYRVQWIDSQETAGFFYVLWAAGRPLMWLFCARCVDVYWQKLVLIIHYTEFFKTTGKQGGKCLCAHWQQTASKTNGNESMKTLVRTRTNSLSLIETCYK